MLDQITNQCYEDGDRRLCPSAILLFKRGAFVGLTVPVAVATRTRTRSEGKTKREGEIPYDTMYDKERRKDLE